MLRGPAHRARNARLQCLRHESRLCAQKCAAQALIRLFRLLLTCDRPPGAHLGLS